MPADPGLPGAHELCDIPDFFAEMFHDFNLCLLREFVFMSQGNLGKYMINLGRVKIHPFCNLK